MNGLPWYTALLSALTLTGSCYSKYIQKRLDRSPELQKIALERIKKSSQTIERDMVGIRVAAEPPVKMTIAQIMAGAKNAATVKKTDIPAQATTNPLILNQFTSAHYRQTGQYGPSSEAGKGSTQIIIGQKGRVMSFLTDGTPDNVLNVSHDHFFSSVSRGGFTADPNIIFDASSGRWFLFCDGAFPYLLLAMIDGDPVTSDTVVSFFIIDSTTNPGFNAVLPSFDYTTLGLDANAIYCAANVYDDTNPTYLSSAAYVVLKDSLINGQTPVIYAFRNLVDQATYNGPFTLQGALNFDANPAAGFFVSINLLDVLVNSSQKLLLNKATFTTTGVTLSAPVAIPVTPYVGPLFASALGTPEPLFDPGVRLCPAHIRNGILRVVHEIGVDNKGISTPATVITRNAANFYEIALSNRPAVVNQGRVFQSSLLNDFNQRCFLVPSIMSNSLGQIIISATTCGTQERLNASATQIKNGIPGIPVLYTNSTSNYFATEDWEFDPHSRWGDHTRVSADPNDTTFWAASLWCNATNTWASQIAHIQAQ